MSRAIFVLLFFISLTAVPAPASAQTAAWRVEQAQGLVSVHSTGQTHEARVNETLPAGAVITTGADSRATLANAGQRMVLAPNSRAAIPLRAAPGMTRILQSFGSIFFQVDHQSQPHFIVETSRLAAVVKGTTFTITTNPEFDMISVAHGLVEVHALESQAEQDVATGQAARVLASAPADIALNNGDGFRVAGQLQAGADGLRGATSAQSTEEAEAQAEEPNAPQTSNLGAPLTAGRVNSGTDVPHLSSLAPVAGLSAHRATASASSSRASQSNQDFLKFFFTYLAGSFGLGFVAFVIVRSLAEAARHKLDRTNR